MPWYDGPTLMEYLEAVEVVSSGAGRRRFAYLVQSVNRTEPDFRGYAGTVAAGAVAPGERVVVLPAGIETIVGASSPSTATSSARSPARP